MRLPKNETESRKIMQLLFLFTAACLPFFAVFVGAPFPAVGYHMAKEYIIIPCLLFFGSALTQPLSSSAKKCLLLSGLAVFWFIATSMQHHLSYMGTRNLGIFAVAYLTAFPFATATEDGSSQHGLKWVGGLYMAASLFLVVLTILLQLNAVPKLFTNFVIWDGPRLSLFWHPNGSACVLMMGIGFTVYFLTQAKTKWKKSIFILLTVAQFLTISLTNSRTAIFLTCALFAGTVFFMIWKGSWKQFLVGAAAAVLVLTATVFLHSTLFDLHSDIQFDKLMKEAAAETTSSSEEQLKTQILEVDPDTGEISIEGTGGSGQGDLSADMRHLNGRTALWKAAISSLQDNPTLRIWGTEYVTAELSWRSSVFHLAGLTAHNAWLQTAMLMGIPGLLIALAFTVVAAWNLWILLWRPQEDLSKKVVALMVVCILGASLLEVYLFTGEDIANSENFFFMLCTGYLVQWNRTASRKK